MEEAGAPSIMFIVYLMINSFTVSFLPKDQLHWKSKILNKAEIKIPINILQWNKW
jgi:hypothetical protein